MEKTGQTYDKLFAPMASLLVMSVLFIALYRMGRPLALDDTHSTHHALNGILGVIDNLRTDAHPPLYFMLLAGWIKAFGQDEVALRSLSVLFYLLTGAVLFVYGLRTQDKMTGYLAALFFFLSPLAVLHGHGVRMYSLSGLLAALSTILFLEQAAADGRGKKSLIVAYIACNSIGTLTHYWFFFLLMAQGVAAIFLSKGRARTKLVLALITSGVPFAILWSPLLLQQLGGSPTSWIGRTGPLEFLVALADLYGGIDVLFILSALTAICLVRVRKWRLEFIERGQVAAFFSTKQVQLLLVIFLLTALLPFALSQYRPIFLSRYLIVALPAIALLLALLARRLGQPRLVLLFCTAMIVGATFSFYRSRSNQTYSDRASVEYILDRYEDGDELIYITLSVAPLRHYLRVLAPERSFSETTYPREVLGHIGWRDVDGMLESPRALELEAERVVQDLTERKDWKHAWLFYGEDKRIGDFLKEKLDDHFQVQETVPIAGSWHEEIIVYGPRNGTGAHVGEVLEADESSSEPPPNE